MVELTKDETEYLIACVHFVRVSHLADGVDIDNLDMHNHIIDKLRLSIGRVIEN